MRADTIREEAWRIAFVQGGRVVDVYPMTGEAGGRAFLRAAAATTQKFDSAFLQVRRAGASRYADIVQLVGRDLIEWGAA